MSFSYSLTVGALIYNPATSYMIENVLITKILNGVKYKMYSHMLNPYFNDQKFILNKALTDSVKTFFQNSELR